MSSIAIITARSGSKGIKDKNIRPLCEKPLMAYSIEAAVESGMFDTVTVSTDSEKYAEIARCYGAEVPFLRSGDSAKDNSSSWDAVKETLKGYERLGKKFDTVMLLQPTSPLRDATNIREAFALYESLGEKAKAIVSVCELGHSLNYVNTLPEDLSLKGFLHDASKYARQMNPVYYRFNGALYLTETEHLFKSESIFEDGCYAYVMDELHSVDIDKELDLIMCEAVIRKQRET